MGESTILSLMPCFSFKTKKKKKAHSALEGFLWHSLSLGFLPSRVHVVLLQMTILTEMFCTRVLSPPVKCVVRGSYPLQLNVLCEGPIPSSQFFCMRVLSPPFKCLVRGVLSLPVNCFVWGSYPHQSLCDTHWLWFFMLMSYFWPLSPLVGSLLSPLGQAMFGFRYCNSVEMGSFFLPVKLGAKPLSGLRTGHSSFILAFWAGNCCQRHPFSLVLKPR